MEGIKIDNYSLAILICQELIQLGIRQTFFPFDSTFSQFELEQIESLVISGCDSIKGIEKLTNLKYLTILGVNLNSFQGSTHSQNNIGDFGYLNLLKKLEKLSIIYDFQIEDLDISSLDGLKSLRLFCNPKLRIIQGLDTKQQLEEVSICGCPIEDIGNVKLYIDNTKDTVINIWDIEMFTSLLKDLSLRNYIKGKMYDNLTNLSFGEHIYFYDEVYVMDWYQMNDMYNRANRILRELHLEELGHKAKAYAIYQYIIKHLQYDYEGLKYRDKNYEAFEYMNGEEKKYFMRRLATINSSFGALTRRKVVCDGYVNLMKFLLAICGIESRTVICSHQGRLHSAIKFKIDGIWYYADPEQDQRLNYIQYFGLTYSEFSTVYTLAPQEQIDNQITKKKVINHG